MKKNVKYNDLSGDFVNLTTDPEENKWDSSIIIVKDIIFSVKNPSVIQVVWNNSFRGSTFISGVPFYYQEFK